MVVRAKGIQPSVLRWAREHQGYSIEDVAERLKRSPEEIESWENGQSFPTYVQLETLAYQLYKRPIAIFFLPQPPEETSPKEAFRTLPKTDIDTLAADTRYRIRYAKALQISLRDLNEGKNPIINKIFDAIKLKPQLQNLSYQARKVREYLGISLQEQIVWNNVDVAIRSWRTAIEEKGIFVFKKNFKEDEISGFCLIDDEFPIIYLNNSTTKTRQNFSLFHELAHILVGIDGISKFGESYISQLSNRVKPLEKFCNKFASEFLMPSEDFNRMLQSIDENEERSIELLADRYCVSREVVLRRLLDKNLLSRTEYETKVSNLPRHRRKKKGGSYYANQATYLGERYLKLVFSKYYQGNLTAAQAADYLGVKTKSLPGMELKMLNKAIA